MSDPAAVSVEAIRKIVEEAMQSAIPETWEVSSHAARRIAALFQAQPREIEELKAELKQCRKEKNDLVLKAYPAMDQRDDLLKAASLAFGCLWRDLSGNLLAIDARKHLSAVLSQDAKKTGIEEALGRYGHPEDGETLEAVDRAFPPDFVRAAAGEAKQKARAEAAEARVAALTEALRPFSHVARAIPATVDDCAYTEVSRELGQTEDDALMDSLALPRNKSPNARTRESYCLDGLRVSDWRRVRRALTENTDAK